MQQHVRLHEYELARQQARAQERHARHHQVSLRRGAGAIRLAVRRQAAQQRSH